MLRGAGLESTVGSALFLSLGLGALTWEPEIWIQIPSLPPGFLRQIYERGTAAAISGLLRGLSEKADVKSLAEGPPSLIHSLKTLFG